jgi:hypothetical protein
MSHFADAIRLWLQAFWLRVPGRASRMPSAHERFAFCGRNDFVSRSKVSDSVDTSGPFSEVKERISFKVP